MTQIKRFLASIIASLFCVLSYAQHSTSSPYSTIGIGEVDSKIYGLNSGMANVGIGTYRQGFLNNTNPAAIAVDSSYFIFDISLSGSLSRYSTAEMTEYANNDNVKKVAFGVRIFSKLAVSAGILPYSNVQYRIQSEGYVEGKNNEKYTLYHEGSGGLSKTYLTATYKLLPYLYAGVNTSYLFGRINRSESLSSQTLQTISEVDKILFDFGLMYNKRIASSVSLSAGLVFGYESKIKMKNYKTLSSLGTTETESSTYTSLPRNIGAGFTLQNSSGHSFKMFAIDYKFHNWANIKSPDQRMRYTNNHRINAGAEYIPNYRTPRNYLQRVQYQAGAYFERSNLVINGKQISEMGATVGLVLPLKNNYTQIFLSADVGHRGGKGLINEDYIRINLGVSVNQLWFIKWAYQ
ncbi:MAG: hypothetical protein LBD76_06275 [Prevotellaceae bacterium]|jgi:hypothetical protein|nr:hypothetical protein [Prevotellaceae bacterium]